MTAPCTEKETLADIKMVMAENKTLLADIQVAVKTMQADQQMLHKRMFESNGERAIVEIVRENAAWREKMDKLFKKAVAGMIALVLGGHGLDRFIDFWLRQ